MDDVAVIQYIVYSHQAEKNPAAESPDAKTL
jgi:hypothetical protein